MAFRSRRGGFTMVEMAISVAVVGILAALGAGAIVQLLPRYNARRAAWSFASDLARARMLAVRENVEYRIYLSAYDTSLDSGPNMGEYLLQVGDKSQSSNYWDTLPKEEDAVRPVGCPGRDVGFDYHFAQGTITLTDGADDEIPDVSIAPWTSLQGPTSTCQSNEDAIVFSPRGWLTNPNADFGSSGFIEVDFVNKDAYMKGRTEVYRVSVARAGFARVDYITESRYTDTKGNEMGLDSTTKTDNASAGGGSE